MRSIGWRWHLDEVFVKINGQQHYLWRAVDHEGEVLESFVTKTRDSVRCSPTAPADWTSVAKEAVLSSGQAVNNDG